MQAAAGQTAVGQTAAGADGAAIGRSMALDESLERAHRMAVAQGHAAVTLEHMLFALSEDVEATSILAASNVSLEKLRTDLSAYIGRLGDTLPATDGGVPRPGADLLRILQLAGLAARQSQRRSIDGAIVLAAIIGDGNSPAAGMLKAHGLTFEEVIRVLQSGAGPRETSAREAAVRPAPMPPAAAPPPAEPPVATVPPTTAPPAAATSSASEDALARARARVKQVEPPTLPIRTAPVTQPVAGSDVSAAAAIQPPQPPATSTAGSVAPAVTQQAPAVAGGERSDPRPPLSELRRPPTPTVANDGPPTHPAPQPGPQPAPATGLDPARAVSLSAAPPPSGQAMPPAPPVVGARPPLPVPPAPPPSAATLPGQAHPAAPAASAAQPPPAGARHSGAIPQAGPPAGPAAARQPPAGRPQAPGTLAPPPQQHPAALQGARPPVAPPAIGHPGLQAAQPPVPTLASAGPPAAHRPPMVQPYGAAPPPHGREPSQVPPLLPAEAVNVVDAAAGLPAIVRIGTPVLVEIRVPRSQADVPRAGARGGLGAQEPAIVRAVTARLQAASGSGLFIEPRTPETVWLDGSPGGKGQSDVVWQYVLTPQRKGMAAVTLTIAGRTLSPFGSVVDPVAATETFAVTIRRRRGTALRAVARILGLAAIGAAAAWSITGPLAGPLAAAIKLIWR